MIYNQLQDQLHSITFNYKTNYYQLQWSAMICNDLHAIMKPIQWFTTNYNLITITITMIYSQFRSDYNQLQDYLHSITIN